LKVHPVAALFPMMSPEEQAALAADIAERGQLQPIVIGENGEILDGRNRAVACEMAGVQPSYTRYEGNDPAGYALAANVQRRNLSTSQKYMIMEMARRLNGNTKVGITTSEWEAKALSQAATVIDYGGPGLAAEVAAGVTACSLHAYLQGSALDLQPNGASQSYAHGGMGQGTVRE
jgi:ParB-like nuclease domain